MELDAARCYQAVLSRDRRFDGRFFGGVVTTGIYCRPICPVHPAKPENVRWFACAAAAEAAGFRPNIRARAANAAICIEILDTVFASKPRSEWVGILRRGGDFIFCPINSVDELPDDPQVQANQYIVDLDHPRFGKTQVLGLPVRLTETPGSIRLPAPEFGQHTEEILTGLLGYTWEQIGALKEQEVI